MASKSYASVFQKAAGGDANLVFRNVIRLLHERKLLYKVEEIMTDLVGAFSIRLNHNSEFDTYLKVEVSLDGRKFIPLDLAGTGVLQLLQIISYVALFSPIFLLIDEPDNHLHPSRQVLLSRAFDKISSDYGATVVVSTHSRHLLASAALDTKIIWMKDGQVESDDCRDLATVLVDLGALDQLDSRGADCIICTEDRGKNIIESAVVSLGLSDRVKVISYNGINNAGSAVAIKAMCDLLQRKPAVLIHRDRDFLSDAELEIWGKDYTSREMTIFSPPLCDVEAYHCTADNISDVYSIDIAEASNIVSEIIKKSTDELRTKFKDKRREANLKFWRDGGGPATDELWPEGAEAQFQNVCGKELLKVLNRQLPDKLGQRQNLLAKASVEFENSLRYKLEEIGITP